MEARPVDLFESDQPRIWQVSDSRLHLIGLFNWSESDADQISVQLDRLGLDPAQTFVAFDYWADTFVSPFSGRLEQSLAPAGCRVLAVRPIAEGPQLLSTSRHITQGLIDVVEERWDSASRTLSGVSDVVAGDPYELRIALPSQGIWAVRSATAGNQSLTVGETTATGVRLRFTPAATARVSWRVQF